jgi:hypothetical protein
MIPKFKGTRKQGHKLTAYHDVLSRILLSIHQVQVAGGLSSCILGPDGIKREFLFKCPICVVIRDVEGHNKLCGHFASHMIATLNRECDVKLCNADNPYVICHQTKASDIANLVAARKVKKLTKCSYHQVCNAFTPLDFGANVYGINGATPGEVLHMIQSRWLSMSVEGFYVNGLSSSTVSPALFLDDLSKQVSTQLSQQSDWDFPKTKFGKSVSTLAQLHSHDYSGVLLLLVVTLFLHACWLQDTDNKNSIGRSTHGSVDQVKVEEYCNLFENLLCFESWYCLDHVCKEDIKSGAAKKQCSMSS